ncbi:MAG: hypothetical protein ACK4WM_10510, partial [Thermoflexales bacterium]
LPDYLRTALITAAASRDLDAIERVIADARHAHPERFVSAEEERLRLIAREALEGYVSMAQDLADHARRRADMHRILAALRRGLSLETPR